MHRIGERAAWLAVLATLVSLVAATSASAAHNQHRHHKRHATLGLVTHSHRFTNSAGRRHANHVPPHGSYSLTITPGPSTAVGSGQTDTIKATFTNESSSHRLGSADLFAPFVPSPSQSFKVLSASSSAGSASVSTQCPLWRWHVSCVQLRNAGLAPHASLTVTMSVQTPVCAQGSHFFWLVDARQSGDFGYGSWGGPLVLDLSHSQLRTALDGACTLAFATGPTSALPGAVITGTADDPSGPPIAVQVLDRNGAVVSDADAPITVALSNNPTAAALSGTPTENASSGVATFADLSLTLPGSGYQLQASSGSLSPATSLPFDIAGTSTTCDVNQSCQVTDSNPAGSANIVADAGPGEGQLVESIEAPLTNGECAGYNSLDQNGYVYESTVARSTVVTITIVPQGTLKSPPAKVLASQQICFGATQEFIDNLGQLAPSAPLPGGESGFVGLLPDCNAGSTGPCHDRASDKTISDPDSPTGFDVVLVADVPPGFALDPHMS
jgi:hypothetical protein